MPQDVRPSQQNRVNRSDFHRFGFANYLMWYRRRSFKATTG